MSGLLLVDPYKPPRRGWLRVEGDRIVEIVEGDRRSATSEPIIESGLGEPPLLICPGFIDAHLHLPQIDSIGCDGMELLDWLQRVIFPAEMRWSDETYAARQVAWVYQRLLRAGTLGFAAYLTSHFHGYIHVVRAGHQLPLRAAVGQILMDRNCPPELVTSNMARIASSERSRVQASVNPRFLPGCTESMLATAANKMREGYLVQTHLAESEAERELTHQLFPNDDHDAAVLDRFGLLTSATLLAHCVRLDDAQWRLIAERESVVVHCPAANVFLKSGLFDLDAARRHGVRLALGSDIAAGPDIAMPRVARAMIETAKVRSMHSKQRIHIPTPAEAWSLMTRGNAAALGWADAGRLESGASADLLALQLPERYFDEHLIGRLIYGWDDALIAHRVVAGKLVKLGN